MTKRWKVNDGTQVDVGGKFRLGGEEFTATDDELDEYGSRPYVTEIGQPAENKAHAAPKARDAKEK